MKVPCRWLAEYVAIEVTEQSIRQVAQRLTLAGLEVEAIARVGALSGAVVGHVVTCDAVPESDHLHLCSVDVGSETLQIVCGAPNVAAGMTVPVVKPGGRLPGGMAIDRRTIRGQPSHGMICSKAELGLEERSEGIWPLSEALRLSPGTDLSQLLEHDDFILDIKVPSNRPDAASVYGIAREVAALLNQPLAALETSVEEIAPSAADLIPLTIERGEDTPRYAARLMDDVRIGPSPLWLQHRLLKAGMRPLSNLVDATNYVMLELGHPLHPFDAQRLKLPIVVRRARADEPFQTLDGIVRQLTPEALLVADQEGGIALAGVMGGQRSEIRPDTTRVVLEIASFSGHRVRLSSRSVGVRSEASQRFERGLPPASVPFVADRAAHLIQQLTGCRVHAGLADAYAVPESPRSLRLRPDRAAALLGVPLNEDTCKDLLARLQLPTQSDGGALQVEVPHHRVDLEREVDLIEEVGRIHGYDRLISQAPRAVVRVGRKDPTEQIKDRVRDSLVGQGMAEVMTDGFDHRVWRERLGMPDDDLIRIVNPMSQASAALRHSLIPDLLHVVETNLRQGVDGGMLFEWSRTFTASRGEEETLAGVLFGRTGRPLRGKEMVSLPLAKGILDSLFDRLRLPRLSTLSGDLPRFLHPHQAVRLACGEHEIGLLGSLHASLMDSFPLRLPIVVFELRASVLVSNAKQAVHVQPVSAFPASKRDLSVSAPKRLAEERIREALLAESCVESVSLYDRYQGQPVPEDQVSLTYELSFRADDHTLTDDEVAVSMDRIARRLSELDVFVRSA